MHRKLICFLAALCLLCGLAPLQAEETNRYLRDFEKRVTEFTLDNGLHFLVIERHQAPVASFVTFVDAGSVNEPCGKTGVAHLFEHMAFKGTKRIGTTNWAEEKKVLEKLDAVYAKWQRAKQQKGKDAREKAARLRQRFEELQEEAGSYVKSNEFSKIIEKNGGTHLNAGTAADFTVYFCSLPANRAQLWFLLESDRLQHPVWREFYTEKQVVREERRMRVESSPTGRLFQDLRAVAYIAHPYRNPTIGWRSDLASLSKPDIEAFYDRHYTSRNITLAIAGDVQPRRMRELAERYFGGFNREGPKPKERLTEEPDQFGRRELVLKKHHQPVYTRAYHAVAQDHPDAPALELLADILTSGRTSRLYTRLVEEERLAAQVHAFEGFPGDKYPSLFAIYAIPNKGVDLDELAKAVDRELEKVKAGELQQEELDRARTKARANLIRGLDSNRGLARSFAQAQAQRGDWRAVFTHLDRLEEVSRRDIREAARKYLVEAHMTEGRLKNASTQ